MALQESSDTGLTYILQPDEGLDEGDFGFDIAIKPLLDANGDVQRALLKPEQIFSEENNRYEPQNRERYALTIAAGKIELDDTVACYLAQHGWVIERRKANAKKVNLIAVKRFRDFLSKYRGKIGHTLFMRGTDAKPNRRFSDTVAGLETNDLLSVSAVTQSHSHGLYVGKVDGKYDEPKLRGNGLEDEQIEALRIVTLNRHMPSRASEAPRHTDNGLNYVYAHNRGVAFYDTIEETDPVTGKKKVTGRWSRTVILPSGDMALPGANCTALQYAQEGYEGIVGMGNEKTSTIEGVNLVDCEVSESGEITLFRIEENAKRFIKTAQAMGAPPISVEQFVETVQEVVRNNVHYVPKCDGAKLYVRPYFIGIEGGAGANAAKRYIFGVEVFPYGIYMASKESAIKVEGRLDLHRPDSGADKVGPNYSTGFVDKADAKARGYNDLMMFDREGFVEEVSTCAVFFVRKNKNGALELHTPMTRDDVATAKPKKDGFLKKTAKKGIAFLARKLGMKVKTDEQDRKNALPSITRKSMIEIARRLGYTVHIRDIHASEIPGMNGCFTVGTAVGVTNVGSIDVKRNKEDIEGPQCMFDDPEARNFIHMLYDLQVQARTGTLTDERLKDLNDTWVTRIPVDARDFAE